MTYKQTKFVNLIINSDISTKDIHQILDMNNARTDIEDYNSDEHLSELLQICVEIMKLKG